jgi:DinB superfamily
MQATAHIAKHLRDVYFGGNWTTSSFKTHLDGITWQQATTQVHGFNTLATLVFHTSYYIGVASKVLKGGPLSGKDKDSFECPPIVSQEDWDNLLSQTYADVEAFAALIEQLPEDKLWAEFTDPKYGDYYRNLTGIIEHAHYHLGQMVLIKRLVTAG